MSAKAGLGHQTLEVLDQVFLQVIVSEAVVGDETCLRYLELVVTQWQTVLLVHLRIVYDILVAQVEVYMHFSTALLLYEWALTLLSISTRHSLIGPFKPTFLTLI